MYLWLLAVMSKYHFMCLSAPYCRSWWSSILHAAKLLSSLVTSIKKKCMLSFFQQQFKAICRICMKCEILWKWDVYFLQESERSIRSITMHQSSETLVNICLAEIYSWKTEMLCDSIGATKLFTLYHLHLLCLKFIS